MSKFPLYDNLSKDIPDKELTTAQKKSFLKKIGNIDQEGHETMYALIRMYQIENNTGCSGFEIPYRGMISNGNITFDINNFPKKLKHMLYRFLDIHLKNMKEEKKILNTPVRRI